MTVKSIKNSGALYFETLSMIPNVADKKHFIQTLISSDHEKQKLLKKAVYENQPELVDIILEQGTKFDQRAQSKGGRLKKYAVPKIVDGKIPIKQWTVNITKVSENKAGKLELEWEDDEASVHVVYEDNKIVNKDMVKVMLNSGLTLDNFFESSELLYSAVQNQDEEFVEYLVEKGARGDEKFGAYNGKTLEHAVMSGNAKIVQTILDVENPPYVPYDLVCYAALSGNADIVKSLIEVRSKYYSLCSLPENTKFNEEVSLVLQQEQRVRDSHKESKKCQQANI
jgi:hypothetical protein